LEIKARLGRSRTYELLQFLRMIYFLQRCLELDIILKFSSI